MLAVTLGCPNYGVPGLLGTNPGSAGAFSVVPMRSTKHFFLGQDRKKGICRAYSTEDEHVDQWKTAYASSS